MKPEGKGIRCAAHADAVALRVCMECRKPICAECACIVGMTGLRPLAKGATPGSQEAYCRECGERIVEEVRAARPTASTTPRAIVGAILGGAVGGFAYAALTSAVPWTAGWFAFMVGLLTGTSVLSFTAGKRGGLIGIVAAFGTMEGCLVAAWRLGATDDLRGYFLSGHQLMGSAVAVMVAILVTTWRRKRRRS
ncbi:MAG: B-box zinc finger protein [Planctomycetota bacterium]